MKIGDLVSVLDDDLKGRIIFLQKDHVTIEDEHGFHYTFPKKQIVPQIEDIYKKVALVKKAEISKKTSKKHRNEPEKLDLHFEKLVKNPHNYTPSERILIQRDALLNKLDYCREHRLKKLRIVHGVGDGVVQQMVHDVLAGQLHLEFDDHSFFYHQTGSLLVTFR